MPLPQLLSVSEAQERLFRVLGKKPPQTLPLDKVNRLLLAEDIFSPIDLPPFANSSMDGFAVRTADLKTSPTILEVIEDIPAGYFPSLALHPGQSSRVMTGAPLPAGADAVIPVEETDQTATLVGSPLPTHVTIFGTCQEGQYIRPQGQDLRTGQLLLPSGHILTPADIGLLAACGIAKVTVIPQPRIALFSSGDELVSPGAPLASGQIYDSNQYLLASLLAETGAEVISLGIARDQPAEIDAILQRAVKNAPDIIVSTAGVSVGAYDYIRRQIELAGKLDFWRVNMRPGKPIAIGSYQSIPFFGLPGNPVSAYVGCLVFLLPAIRLLSGLDPFKRQIVSATLEQDIDSDGRESYLRATVTKSKFGFSANLTGHQGSANLFALSRSNALLIVPSGVKSLPAGEKVNAWLLTETEKLLF